MRIKTFAVILLFMTITLHLQAEFSVTDIEYLKGDDFVQVHFVTDNLIPIPDLFYPEEDNSKLIVMRVSDVKFNLTKDLFKFDSPVISNLNVKKAKDYTDVVILLKEKVNYRVFTNQKGLYIEFPNVKRIMARTETIAPPPVSKPVAVKKT